MRGQIEKSYGMPIILNKHIKDKEGKYLVFCKKKRHLQEIKETVVGWFRTAGCKNINAYEVYSDYENKDAEYKAFCDDKSHNLKLMFCVDMLNEGLHLENISGVLLLRPTRSSIVWLQQIGRAIEANNTNTPVIIDAVNNFSSVGQGMRLLKEIKDIIAIEKESDPDFDDSIFEEIDTFFVVGQILEIQEMFKEIEDRLQGKAWTEKEDEFIQKNYSKLTYREMSNFIERTPKSISERAKRLGIVINKDWTEEEIGIMEKYYLELGGNKIAQYMPNRTIQEIMAKAAKMNLIRNKKWTNEEKEIIKKYYPTMGTRIHDMLPGRTVNSIRRFAWKLGVSVNKKEKETNSILNINQWRKEEDEILICYFEDFGYKKIMEMLPNRTRAAIANRVSKLGLYYDVSKHRKSKYKYVYYIKNQDKWNVKIRIAGKYKSFGYYKTEDEAGRVAIEKAKEHDKVI